MRKLALEEEHTDMLELANTLCRCEMRHGLYSLTPYNVWRYGLSLASNDQLGVDLEDIRSHHSLCLLNDSRTGVAICY